jgi:hypothetical protein
MSRSFTFGIPRPGYGQSMSPGPSDYLYDTRVHLPDGREKRFGDLTKQEEHDFMDFVDSGDLQAVYDASLLRLRAYAVSIGAVPDKPANS